MDNLCNYLYNLVNEEGTTTAAIGGETTSDNAEYIPAALGGTIKPAKKKREKTDGKKRKKD